MLYVSALRILLHRAKVRHELANLKPGIELANQLIAGALHHQYILFALEALLVRAQLYAALRDEQASLADCAHAVELAEPEGFLSIFVEEGPPIATALAVLLKHDRLGAVQRNYAETILATFSRSQLPGAAPTPPRPTASNGSVSALIEPFACVLRGQNALRIQPGETVLVMGAGPIGVMHAKLARLRGAARVVVSEPNAERLERAVRMAADMGVNPATEDLAAALAGVTDGRGADVIVVAAPAHQAQEQALQLAAIGGRINFFGGLPKDHTTIQFDSNLVHYKELVVTATTACSTADCRQAAEIVNSRRIDLSDLISARYALQDALAAFTAAEDRKSLKVVIEP